MMHVRIVAHKHFFRTYLIRLREEETLPCILWQIGSYFTLFQLNFLGLREILSFFVKDDGKLPPDFLQRKPENIALYKVLRNEVRISICVGYKDGNESMIMPLKTVRPSNSRSIVE
jgi:hypothetical protein